MTYGVAKILDDWALLDREREREDLGKEYVQRLTYFHACWSR
jgi:hypothetical protein